MNAKLKKLLNSNLNEILELCKKNKNYKKICKKNKERIAKNLLKKHDIPVKSKQKYSKKLLQIGGMLTRNPSMQNLARPFPNKVGPELDSIRESTSIDAVDKRQGRELRQTLSQMTLRNEDDSEDDYEDDTEDEMEREPVPPEKMNPNEIMNFTDLYDNKKMTQKEIDNIILDKLKDQDPRVLVEFYKYHLDLIVENESLFKDKLPSGDSYYNYKNVYNQIKKFIGSLNESVDLASLSKSRRNMLTESLGRFTKYPSKSIFNKIDPKTFAEKCHKLHMYYYFMMETRILQYISKSSKRKSNSIYVDQFKALINNFYRKMEYEIELYCNTNKFATLNEIFKQMLETFLKLGNTPFSKWTITLIKRYKICKPNEELQELLNVDLKTVDKYPYLVDYELLISKFIASHEVPSKFKSFAFIFTKITETKNQILNELKNDDLEYASITELQIYEYLQPNSIIKTQLYIGAGEIDCIKKCENP